MVSTEQLRQLKVLLGIDPADTTQDEKLMIELQSAIEVCVVWFEKYGCNPLQKDGCGYYVIPSSVMIAISKYVQASTMTAGVKSESIGGMSVSYGGATGVNSTGTPLDDLYAYLDIYRCRKIGFVPMRK